MKSDPKTEIISYAVTKKQKLETIKKAEKSGKKVSRYVADIVQKELDKQDDF